MPLQGLTGTELIHQPLDYLIDVHFDMRLPCIGPTSPEFTIHGDSRALGLSNRCAIRGHLRGCLA